MTYFLRNWLTKVKPNINSVEVHPQVSNNGHPVDGALVSHISNFYFLFLDKKFLCMIIPLHVSFVILK